MSWATMATELFGGLALFLLGLEQLTTSMRGVAGARLKAMLSRLTSNRFTSVLSGAGLTAVVQSSSVTTVLVVGLVSAGLLSLSQSVGVIMGANIGTTITAQIIAFKVTKAALALVAVGFAGWFFGKREAVKNWGGVTMALGLVFLGMNVMGQGMAPLRSDPGFIDLMVQMESPLYGIAVAAAFTALVQSSSATTGIVVAMAAQGIVTLPAGIALTLGANVGTCVTAGLAAVGKSREAQRTAMVHVLFNVLGVLIWVGFVDQLAELSRLLSPAYPELTGADRISAEVPRQIANAHTVFNVANTVILIWFSSSIARAAERLIPDRPLEEASLRHYANRLPPSLIATPGLALDVVRRELRPLGDHVVKMLEAILPAVFSGDLQRLHAVEEMDEAVDERYAALVAYLARLGQQRLSDDESDDLAAMLEVANDLETIGDIIETNIVNVGLRLAEDGVPVSEETQAVLSGLGDESLRALTMAIDAVVEQDHELARELVAMKEQYKELTHEANLHQMQRLAADEPNRLAAYRSEIEIIGRLRRIYYHAKRMAKTVPRD